MNNILDIKVGHLPRDKVLYLAPMLDRKLVHHASGVVTTGANNKYSIPVTLFLWGLPENKEEVIKRCRLGQLVLGNNVEPAARRVMELEPVTRTIARMRSTSCSSDWRRSASPPGWRRRANDHRAAVPAPEGGTRLDAASGKQTPCRRFGPTRRRRACT